MAPSQVISVAGNGQSKAKDYEVKIAPCPQWVSAETGVVANKSRQFGAI